MFAPFIGMKSNKNAKHNSKSFRINAGILLIVPLATNLIETRTKIEQFLYFIPENEFENVVWKMAAIYSMY